MDVRDFYAYTAIIRRPLLEALAGAPSHLLEGSEGTGERSILHQLLHIMALEETWIREDVQQRPSLTWTEFVERYLGGDMSVGGVIRGWNRISHETMRYLRDSGSLTRRVELPGEPARAVTVEQVLLHLVAQELIGLGQIRERARILGIAVPEYSLLPAMDENDRPWDTWSREDVPSS